MFAIGGSILKRSQFRSARLATSLFAHSLLGLSSMIPEFWRTRSIQRVNDAPAAVAVVDQRRLPFAIQTITLQRSGDAIDAIQHMVVRGAPLIGVTGAYGIALAAQEAPNDQRFWGYLAERAGLIANARPTAINLAWGVNRMMEELRHHAADINQTIATAWQLADAIADEDAATCNSIGLHGRPLIEEIAKRKNGAAVNILTHCNAGRLACVAWGTATAPIYHAHHAGIPVHVWVDETRPRNQGARLTTWELAEAGIPHTLVVDNAGGHLMQHGLVDIVLVGSDRTTRNGDVCNKIGTYLKALAAHDNRIPFYAALPSSTLDWEIRDGVGIPIEERAASEVRCIEGMVNGAVHQAEITLPNTPISNFGFDVTPARLVSGLITERGICSASQTGIQTLFADRYANK